jgi:hypothetical protein
MRGQHPGSSAHVQHSMARLDFGEHDHPPKSSVLFGMPALIQSRGVMIKEALFVHFL